MAQTEKSPEHARGRGREAGSLGISHFAIIALLVTPPALAIYRGLGPVASGWIGGWCAALSGFAYLMYAWDKRQAQKKEWREPESLLHLVELAGGWPGAFLAQRKLRHKSSKVTYQFVFWLIVLGYEFVAIDFLRGWPLLHQVVSAIK